MKHPRTLDASKGTADHAPRLLNPRLGAGSAFNSEIAPAGAVNPDPGMTAGERLSFLHEASARIGGALDEELTVREFAAQVVPRFADFVSVHLCDQRDPAHDPWLPGRPGSKVLRHVTVADACDGEARGPMHTADVSHYPQNSAVARFLDSGEPVLIQRVGVLELERLPEQFDTPAVRLLLRDSSVMAIQLVGRGTVHGFLVLGRRLQRAAFDGRDLATARDLAARTALCVDNARLYDREVQAALAFQDSMLPTRLPQLQGTEIAYRYLPCNGAARVGGDWFDVIALPGRKVALVIGDVTGHGLHAAAVMGKLRTAVQTLALLDLHPAEVLRHLDQIAQRFSDTHLATCLYCVYDPATRRAEIANAGHPPPILIHPAEGARPLAVPSGVPIGVGGVPFAATTFHVPDESVLVFYTDGLVEVPGQDVEMGIHLLCDRLTAPPRSLEAACDEVLSTVDTENRRDDMALLMARLHGFPPQSI